MSSLLEARNHQRFTARRICSYLHRGKRFLTMTVNIGLGGMKIETGHYLQKDDLLDIQIILDDKSIWVKGRAVYSHLLSGKQILSGIQFVDVSEQDLSALREQISALPKPRDMLSVRNGENSAANALKKA